MSFANESELEDALSEPTPAVVELMRRLEGDLIVLGIGGKMGPSLARMAQRASAMSGRPRRVIGVARFSDPTLPAELNRQQIETITCDLLDPAAVERLPEVPNVLYLAGMKFGATGNESTTWAMNAFLPGVIGRKYRHSRIVAFSTGNVYGLTTVAGGGSRESDLPAPVGEYAMSCLGRERLWEYSSRTYHTPTALIRLNYACDLRYGVLVDIAQQVWAGQPVDLRMGYFNTIWQGDANAQSLLAFDHADVPPWIVNLTGPEMLRVRDVALELGQRLQKPVTFTGTEAETALLSNSNLAASALGAPGISASQLIARVADWIQRGGRQLGKPTHFESRDGKF